MGFPDVLASPVEPVPRGLLPAVDAARGSRLTLLGGSPLVAGRLYI